MKQHLPGLKTMAAFVLCTLAAAALPACSVVSRDVRGSAATEVNFTALKQNTDAHVGKTMILGGYILEIRNMSDKTKLMILQTPLDFVDEPKARDLSRGRFIVIHDGFLDPEIYEKDRKLTVAGQVTGTKKVRINEHDFALPALKAVELHLWPKPRKSRQPYYYDPFYGPFYHDPFYPWYGPGLRYRPYPYFYR